MQGRFPARRGVGFSLALGLVATWAALAALSLWMSRSTSARAEAPPSPAAGPPADLILTHGRIYTLDAQKPWAQALAIRGDRILAVGGDREMGALAGPRTRVLDLRGKFALPGFNDAHVHIEATGALLVGANLRDVHEPKAFVERVRAAAARLPRGSWITRGDSAKPRSPDTPKTVLRRALNLPLPKSCASSTTSASPGTVSAVAVRVASRSVRLLPRSSNGSTSKSPPIPASTICVRATAAGRPVVPRHGRLCPNTRKCRGSAEVLAYIEFLKT